jgi:hypothetical protein
MGNTLFPIGFSKLEDQPFVASLPSGRVNAASAALHPYACGVASLRSARFKIIKNNCLGHLL